MYKRGKPDVSTNFRSTHLIEQGNELKRRDKGLKTLNPACGDVDPANKPLGGGGGKVCSMPMKKLIDEEMMKEGESRHRSPSIIARLMGLDALPALHINSKLMRKVSESMSPKLTDVSQQKQCESLIDVYKQHPRNNRSPQIHSSRRHGAEHPEFKDIYEIQEMSRVKGFNYSGRQAGKDRAKLLQSNLAFIRQKFMEAKRLAADEKLSRSKEFRDVLDDLCSNKDLFLRVLQEPDSISSRQPHALHTVPAPSTSRSVTVLKSSKTSIKVECSNTYGSADMNWKSNRKYGDQISLRKGSPKYIIVNSHNNDRLSNDRAPGYQSHKVCQPQNHAGEDDLVAPTRIVVLKPRSFPESKTSALQHSSDNHRRSTARQSSSSQCMLEKEESVSKDYYGVMESIGQRPKSSREIAREVTRQLRQGIERASVKTPSILSSDLSSDEQSFSLLEEEVIDRPRLFAPRRRQAHEVDNKSNSWSPDPMESIVRKEARKRLSERWKTSGSSEGHLERDSDTLGKMLDMPEVEIENKQSWDSLADRIERDGSSDTLTRKYLFSSLKRNTSQRSRDFKTGELDYATNFQRSKSHSGLTERHGFPKGGPRFGSVDDIVNDLIAREVIQQVPVRSFFSERNYPHREKDSTRSRKSHGYKYDLMNAAGDQSSLHLCTRSVIMHSDHARFRSDVDSQFSNDFTDDLKRQFSNEFPDDANQLQESLSVAESYSEIPSEHHQDDFVSLDLESLPQTTDLEDSRACISSDAEKLIAEVSHLSRFQGLSQDGPNDSAHIPPQKETEERLSPVSILEIPFEEESSSSECFEKVSAGLDALRKQLQLLKMGSSQKYDDGNNSEVQSVVEKDEDDMEACYNGLVEEESTQERSLEFAFLHDVVMSSGFCVDSSKLCSWYSPESPLDPRLFEQLDEKYSLHGKFFSRKDKRVRRYEWKLLFDRINSGIISILGKSGKTPWMKSTATSWFPLALEGQQFVKELWELLQNVESEKEEDLIDTVRRDLVRDDGYDTGSGEGVDMIITEIEGAVIGDLVAHMASEFCSTPNI